MRLTVSREGTKLNLHHGIIYLGEDWGTFLDDVELFLDSHPTEALVMTIQ
jgi:hypothetical protein